MLAKLLEQKIEDFKSDENAPQRFKMFEKLDNQITQCSAHEPLVTQEDLASTVLQEFKNCALHMLQIGTISASTKEMIEDLNWLPVVDPAQILGYS